MVMREASRTKPNRGPPPAAQRTDRPGESSGRHPSPPDRHQPAPCRSPPLAATLHDSLFNTNRISALRNLNGLWNTPAIPVLPSAADHPYSTTPGVRRTVAVEDSCSKPLVQRHSLFLGFFVCGMGKQQLARVVPGAVTGKLLLAHVTPKTRCDKALVTLIAAPFPGAPSPALVRLQSIAHQPRRSKLHPDSQAAVGGNAQREARHSTTAVSVMAHRRIESIGRMKR